MAEDYRNERDIELHIKTRGGSLPQGKPRVFFATLKDDFNRFFEDISDDILKYQNCAVYYPETDNGGLSEFDLKNFQLFIVLVTNAIFDEDNYITKEILPFCKENHKPVLPILCEKCNPDIFNDVFGNMQYIDPFSQDATGLSYDQKLKTYLETILVSDELAQKIRDAFDAYVFLSYRKKDREYAQKLMRLIHSNPACRDIAIWYDEFLVPGRSFSDSIKDAFNKSDLFALAVTPSILEDGNYVMEVEYKMATECNAAVLPVELQNTDRKKLEECYKDIPDCVSIEEPEKVISELLSNLKDVDLSKNSKDAKHTFFMGLAYLDGIDVEVDSSKAFSLIKSAADNKLPEAIEKMVHMLRNGEATSRDYRAALIWQDMLVSVYKSTFVENGSFCREYCDALEKRAIYEYEMKETGEAKASLNEILNIGSEESFWIKKYKQSAHRMLGNIAERDEMNHEDAVYHHSAAIELAKELSKDMSAVGAWAELSLDYYSAGVSLLKSQRTKEAEELFKEGLMINKKLIENSDNSNVIAEAQKNCIRLNVALAEICAQRNEKDTAENMFDEALSEARKMNDEYANIHAQRDLLITLNKLGDYYFYKIHDTEKANKFYEEAFEITSNLCKGAPSYIAQEDYAVSLNRLADIAMSEGRLIAAQEQFKESLDILNEIEKALPSVGNRSKIAAASEKMATICRILGNEKEAEEYTNKTIKIRNDIVDESGTLEEKYNLAINLILKGHEEFAKNNNSEAERCYKKAVEYREEIFEETRTTEAKGQVAFALNKLGVFYRKTGKEVEAMKCFNRARTLAEEVVDEKEDPERLRNLYVDTIKVGEGLEAQGKLDEAQECYDKLLPMAEKLLAIAPSSQAKRDYYLCMIKSADIAYKRKKYDVAGKLYDSAMEKAKALYNETGDLKLAYDVMYLDQQIKLVQQNTKKKWFKFW